MNVIHVYYNIIKYVCIIVINCQWNYNECERMFKVNGWNILNDVRCL